MLMFSKELNAFSERRFISMSTHLSSITDWVECSDSDADMFYYKKTIPSGKQRKAGTLELEDMPTQTNSELFAAEFEALKAEHESEINQLNLAFASAALVDGATQESKQTEIRSAYQLAVSENQASVSALMVKYYG